MSFLLGKDNAAWLDLPAFKREVTALDLLEIGAKYAALFCLDARHSNSDQASKQSEHLGELARSRLTSLDFVCSVSCAVVSCCSVSKPLHHLQLNSRPHNASHQFKLMLFPAAHHQPTASSASLTVSVVVSTAKMATLLNGKL